MRDVSVCRAAPKICATATTTTSHSSSSAAGSRRRSWLDAKSHRLDGAVRLEDAAGKWPRRGGRRLSLAAAPPAPAGVYDVDADVVVTGAAARELAAADQAELDVLERGACAASTRRRRGARRDAALRRPVSRAACAPLPRCRRGGASTGAAGARRSTSRCTTRCRAAPKFVRRARRGVRAGAQRRTSPRSPRVPIGCGTSLGGGYDAREQRRVFVGAAGGAARSARTPPTSRPPAARHVLQASRAPLAPPPTFRRGGTRVYETALDDGEPIRLAGERRAAGSTGARSPPRARVRPSAEICVYANDVCTAAARAARARRRRDRAVRRGPRVLPRPPLLLLPTTAAESLERPPADLNLPCLSTSRRAICFAPRGRRRRAQRQPAAARHALDVHATLQHVARAAAGAPTRCRPTAALARWREFREKFEANERATPLQYAQAGARPVGRSLLDELPERGCADAGIRVGVPAHAARRRRRRRRWWRAATRAGSIGSAPPAARTRARPRSLLPLRSHRGCGAQFGGRQHCIPPTELATWNFGWMMKTPAHLAWRYVSFGSATALTRLARSVLSYVLIRKCGLFGFARARCSIASSSSRSLRC